MKRPYISIIIPVYNVQSYLDNCIKSILNQSFQNYEIILVDDGSTDMSAKICDDYAIKDKRIRVVHKKNGGVSSARNIGINLARGYWTYFCDADDELYRLGLEKLLSINVKDIDLICGSYDIYYNQERRLIRRQNTKTVTSQIFLEWLFKRPDGQYYGYLWNKLFKTQIIKQNLMFFDENITINEDRLFIFNYLSKINGKCAYINIPVYKYQQRDDSTMHSGECIAGYQKNLTVLESLLSMLLIVDQTVSSNLYKAIERNVYFSYIKNRELITKFSTDINAEHSQLKLIFNQKIKFSNIKFLRYLILWRIELFKSSLYNYLIKVIGIFK